MLTASNPALPTELQKNSANGSQNYLIYIFLNARDVTEKYPKVRKENDANPVPL